MKASCDILDKYGLKDLGFMGDKYTWKVKRLGGLVLERLDRAVANNQWFSLNLGTTAQHLQTHSSDHKPIIIIPKGIILKQNRPFKFKKMWLHDGGCSETVKSTWGQSFPDASMPLVADKLKTCGDNC